MQPRTFRECGFHLFFMLRFRLIHGRFKLVYHVSLSDFLIDYWCGGGSNLQVVWQSGDHQLVSMGRIHRQNATGNMKRITCINRTHRNYHQFGNGNFKVNIPIFLRYLLCFLPLKNNYAFSVVLFSDFGDHKKPETSFEWVDLGK